MRARNGARYRPPIPAAGLEPEDWLRKPASAGFLVKVSKPSDAQVLRGVCCALCGGFIAKESTRPPGYHRISALGLHR